MNLETRSFETMIRNSRAIRERALLEFRHAQKEREFWVKVRSDLLQAGFELVVTTSLCLLGVALVWLFSY